ncbi:hypothetical protein LL266_18290 [Vibrio anguillarum]|uniref:hypothetical protein n=1 Tax=Vibrio anguillarum TaxID=55601 RepID=UPI0018FEFC7A|nr:hypothetical protein [Vibrio anguillarum]MCC4238420.1 hypothetical protein [Vibrio anguillarum]
MIWVDQASLLKAVNEWPENSPDLFPNNYAFSLRKPNAALRGAGPQYNVSALHLNHET